MNKTEVIQRLFQSGAGWMIEDLKGLSQAAAKDGAKPDDVIFCVSADDNRSYRTWYLPAERAARVLVDTCPFAKNSVKVLREEKHQAGYRLFVIFVSNEVFVFNLNVVSELN
jgi:hypothetical protein